MRRRLVVEPIHRGVARSAGQQLVAPGQLSYSDRVCFADFLPIVVRLFWGGSRRSTRRLLVAARVDLLCIVLSS